MFANNFILRVQKKVCSILIETIFSIIKNKTITHIFFAILFVNTNCIEAFELANIKYFANI